MSERPYTPESLGERWEISERQVRRMLASGHIKGFKLGKLWRISAQEVTSVEARQCLTSSSERIEDNSSPSGGTLEDIASAVRSARTTGSWLS
jgi:excisionase family DNA binding protein